MDAPTAATSRRSQRHRALHGGLLSLAAVVLAGTLTAAEPRTTTERRPASTPLPAAATGSPAPTPTPSEPAGPLALTMSVAQGATNVGVREPVTVTAANGELTGVAVTGADGKPVAGAFDAARRTWRSTEPLAFNRRYTATATAASAKGEQAKQAATFTTVRPGNLVKPYLRASQNVNLADHKTYGVGQVVVVWFDEKVLDRDAATRTLEVKTDPPVEGRWHWFDQQEAHWRPKEYWTPGTKVDVKVNAYGAHLGGNLYGQEDQAASFTIGQKRIAVADNNTKHMQVYVDDALVRTIPVSLGKGGTVRGARGQVIDYWSRTGPHVVLGKAPVTRMTSASYGLTDKNHPEYYDQKIQLTVHISYAGEYLHMADWNIPQHGNTNTSHGCINIGPAHAQWFYDLFGPGDVVDILNTPIKLDARDGLGDWTIPWEQW
jgi:lipoprotein-anchoring transpeptidase ErfK/SrfK